MELSIRPATTRTVFAVLVAMAIVAGSVAWSSPASGVTCGKYVHQTTPASKSNFNAYWFSTQTWQSVSAAWGQVDTVGTAGGCQDVNHRNNNKFSWARAAYYSNTHSRWAHGSVGWVTGGQIGVWVVTISNLPNGTQYRPGTDKTSTNITNAT